MKQYWLGLDIGGTKISVILASSQTDLTIIDEIRFATKSSLGFSYAWENLLRAIDTILEKNKLKSTELSAIGISCGGPLDSRHGIILCPPNLPGWENIPVCEILSEKYHVPVYLQNDANACALAEWKLGAGQGCKHMIFLTMGTGMGAGIISEGKLLCGRNDMCGEVGHIRLSENGPEGFHKHGSFEGWTSGGGIQKQILSFTDLLTEQKKAPVWAREHTSREEWDCRLLAEYARKGDADANALFRQIGHYLGRGLAILTDVMNPEVIVIGSIFVRCEDLLRESMEEELRKEAISYSFDGLKILPAMLGEQLGNYAALLTAMYGQEESDTFVSQKEPESVLYHYNRLFSRYPALEPCRESVLQAYRLTRDTYLSHGKLMLIGNGGSCADCSHIVGELMKGFHLKRPLPASLLEILSAKLDPIRPQAASKLQLGLPAIDLSGHTAMTTAFVNDCDPMLPAVQQLLSLKQENDTVIGISTSGNSENILLTLAAAKALGLKTIGMSGQDGGRMSDFCDCLICVPGDNTADVQELHLPVYHALCSMLESYFFADSLSEQD